MSLLLVKLTTETVELGILPASVALQLLSLPLEIRNYLLSDLEVALLLPSLLINLQLVLLFLLNTAFQIIKSSLKLVLDFVNVSKFLISIMKIL